MPPFDIYSGDASHDGEYAQLQVIKSDGTLALLRIDNSNNATFEPIS